jgi:hypothetical protein
MAKALMAVALILKVEAVASVPLRKLLLMVSRKLKQSRIQDFWIVPKTYF